MTSLLTSCHIQHVCLHYKSVYFIVSCHRQRSTKLSTTYANVCLNACISADGGHFEHITWTRQSHLIWHNFVKVGYNWIKICSLVRIGTYNKKLIKNSQPFVKKWKNVMTSGGGDFCLTHTVYTSPSCLLQTVVSVVCERNHCVFVLWSVIMWHVMLSLRKTVFLHKTLFFL